MNLEVQQMIEDCSRHADLKWVRANRSQFHPSLGKIIDDEHGEQVLESGVAFFAFLADLVKHDFDEGMKAWKVFYEGYEGYPHTDLFAPYFDVARTQLLWFRACTYLQQPKIVNAEIIINLLLRWHLATVELGRKMLIYAAYCRSRENGVDLFNPAKSLIEGSYPTSALNNWGPSDRVEAVKRFYRPEFRHSVAHGNVVCVLPGIVSLRLMDRSTMTVTEEVYDFTQDSEAYAKLETRFHRDIDPLYQTVRVFFSIYTKVQSAHIEVISQYVPDMFTDPTLVAMVRTIQEDPDGLRDWK